MKTLNQLDGGVNEAQHRAITHKDGAMLVLAGPGSGKTFTVTQRIKYLIEQHHIQPEDILVITFTKAAAAEMQERFVKLNDGKCYPVCFGTFHSVFFRILRHTYQFTADNIIREADKYRILAQIIRELPLSCSRRRGNMQIWTRRHYSAFWQKSARQKITDWRQGK